MNRIIINKGAKRFEDLLSKQTTPETVRDSDSKELELLCLQAEVQTLPAAELELDEKVETLSASKPSRCEVCLQTRPTEGAVDCLFNLWLLCL